jgi:hypothetical protein
MYHQNQKICLLQCLVSAKSQKHVLSEGKVVCCRFSSDGKLLSTGGHDKKKTCSSAQISYVFTVPRED